MFSSGGLIWILLLAPDAEICSLARKSRPRIGVVASFHQKIKPVFAGKWLCVVLVEVTFFYLNFAKHLYVPLSTGVYLNGAGQ